MKVIIAPTPPPEWFKPRQYLFWHVKNKLIYYYDNLNGSWSYWQGSINYPDIFYNVVANIMGML